MAGKDEVPISRGRGAGLWKLVRFWFSLLREPTESRLTKVLVNLASPFLLWPKWIVAGVMGPETPCYSSRLDLLSLAAQRVTLDGLWLEFGVHRGVSLNHLARLTHGPVVGFDSFEGLPVDWSPNYRRGTLSTQGKLPDVPPNVRLVKGWFDETAPKFVEEHPKEVAAPLHVDCDVYSSARTVFRETRGMLRPGTVIVFDEFVGPMIDDEARAFREFLRASGLSFSVLGCSVLGSVALVLQERNRPGRDAT